MGLRRTWLPPACSRLATIPRPYKALVAKPEREEARQAIRPKK